MTECPACRRVTVGYEFEPLRGVIGRCSVCRHTAPMTPAKGRDMTIIPHAVRRERDGLCRHGHVLDGDNVYISPSRPGVRQCVVCRRAAWRRSSAQRRQQRRRAA
jgi:hypothetical protein